MRLSRDVAVKLLAPEVAALPKTRERFMAEARAAARLSHPNIVVVYDTGEHDGQPFLVMERLPGRTLADEIEDGPLPVEGVRRVAADVLAALDAAHGAGIVHRDVKPGNVLLCEDGAAKVADFGIAKAVDDVDLTTTGLLLGTPAYLSPEQLAGEAATPASDIYAAGVTLYEALTGTKPYEGVSALALAQAIQTQRATPVAELRSDAPPELVAVIERAMDKDPGRRFATVEDMAAALTTGVAPADAAASPTARLSATQRFGARTERAAWRRRGDGTLIRPVRTLTQRLRGRTLVLAGIVALVLLLVVAIGGRGGSPGRSPAIPPTTVTAAGPSIPPELDRVLQRLEASVRP